MISSMTKIRIFTDLCELLQVRYSQLYALFPSILSGSAQAYFLEHMSRGMQFRDMYLQLKQQFDSDINRAQYHTDWSSITFQTVLSEPKNTGKTYLEVLQILLDRLQRCQRALGPAYKDEIHLVANTLRAVQGVQELKIALARPERSFNALSAQLKSTMKVEENTRSPGHFYTEGIEAEIAVIGKAAEGMITGAIVIPAPIRVRPNAGYAESQIADRQSTHPRNKNARKNSGKDGRRAEARKAEDTSAF
jgi:hypothetical protein